MNDMSVVFSIGHVEGWVNKVIELHPELAELGAGTLLHLKTVEDAYHELRRNQDLYKKLIGDIKGKVDAANAL